MRIGIDLGGTKTEGVLLADDGSEMMRIRYPTPQSSGYEAILTTITNLVIELETVAKEPCTVGIGTPGAISRSDNLLKNSNTPCLTDQPFQTDIEDRLKRLIRIENDANCFAQSEAIDGAGQSFETIFGVILGTGVGGGIVVREKLLQGRLHIAGEWGHNVLEKEGPLCYCGQKGCVETFLSGPGLVAEFERLGGSPGVTAETIINESEQDNHLAKKCVENYLKHFGKALAMVINILDPHAIVLGGGLSNFHRLYTDGYKEVQKHVFWHRFDTPILKHKNGDSAGVRGAAQLWPG